MANKQINVLADEEDQQLLSRLQAHTNLSATSLTKYAWKVLEQVINRRSIAPKMRVYIGVRVGDEGNPATGDRRTKIYVEENGSRSELPASPVEGYEHTPFDWGYYGQGADATAQAIISYEYGEKLAEIYGAIFKNRVIAHLPRTNSQLEGSVEIEEWRFVMIEPL